jgi:hypothetical protein
MDGRWTAPVIRSILMYDTRWGKDPRPHPDIELRGRLQYNVLIEVVYQQQVVDW